MDASDHARLRRWISDLAAIERPSASEGERRAAEWIAAQLRQAGLGVRVDAERAHGTHLPFALPSLLALVTGMLPSRRAAIAGSLLATAAIVDEVEGGHRLLRRALARRQAFNVVAEIGASDAPRTLVFVSHHDTARPWSRAFGALVSAPGPNVPLLEGLVLAPLAVLAGAATGSRGLRRAGMAACAFIVALMADIARRPPVPGANDNAAAVAALLALAHDLTESPPRGARVILLSTGAEETMLEGMAGFLRRNREELDPARTLVVCLDQIGWARLVLRRSEGVLRRYPSRPEDLDAVLRAARSAGVPIEVARPFPTPSDGLAARWAGLPTVCIGSVAVDGGYPHYHQASDLPAYVHITSVDRARRLCHALVQHGRHWPDR